MQISEGFIHSLALLAHWYVSALEVGGISQWRSHPYSLDGLSKYLVQAWNESRTPSLRPPFTHSKDPDTWVLGQRLAMMAIAFVIAHEIGHLIHRNSHLAVDLTDTHNPEYAADNFALEIMTRLAAFYGHEWNRRFHTNFCLHAPYLVVATMCLRGGVQDSIFPNSSDRFKNIVARYPEILNHEREKMQGELVNTFIDQDILRLHEIHASQLMIEMADIKETVLKKAFQ